MFDLLFARWSGRKPAAWFGPVPFGLALLLGAWMGAATAQAVAADTPALEASAPLSANAQSIYHAARDKLLQIRTLRRKTSTQSSIGSGFFVDASGLIVTNYHVVSDLALRPGEFRGVGVSVDGREFELELLAIEVRHDLALLRPRQTPSVPVAWLPLRPENEALRQGERIYALGNPMDVGFALTEGVYNGLVERSFYPQIFFGGALNPGMSGGPALDTEGRVVGVNVAKRLGAEQVSFLMPAEFARQLLTQGRTAQPLTEPAYEQVTQQLLAHQQTLMQRLNENAPEPANHGGYGVSPLHPSLARCWGSGREKRNNSRLEVENSHCEVNSALYTGEGENLGALRLNWRMYRGQDMHPLAFSRVVERSFSNEVNSSKTSVRTAAECHEDFVQLQGMPTRTALCLRAYRKLKGLYDLDVLVASVNQPTQAMVSKLSASGLSFDNAMQLARQYLAGLSWEAQP